MHRARPSCVQRIINLPTRTNYLTVSIARYLDPGTSTAFASHRMVHAHCIPYNPCIHTHAEHVLKKIPRLDFQGSTAH